MLQRLPTMRDRLSPMERLAASVALSVILAMGIALVLARLGIFFLGPLLAVYGAIAATSIFLSREALLEWLHRPTWPRLHLPNSPGEWASLTLPVLTGAAAMYLYLANATQGLKVDTSGWRYMADTRLLLNEGGFPKTSVQWGVERPWALSKVGGSLWIGAMHLVSGLSELDALQYIPLLFLAIAILGSWVLLRLILGRIAASGGLILIFMNYALVPLPLQKFCRLTIEGVALSLTPLMLWALIKGDRDGIPQLRWLASVLLLAIGITHGVVFLMSLTAVGAYLAVKVLSRRPLRSLAQDAALFALAPILVVSGLLVGGQPEILSGVRSESDYHLIDGVGDPTRALYLALIGHSIHQAGPPTEGLNPSPGDLFDRMARRTFSDNTAIGRFMIENNYLTYALVAIAAVAGFALVRSLRWAFAAALVFIAGIYMIAVLFSFRYDLWIFIIHPVRREYPYISFGVLAIGLLLTAYLLRAPWLRNAASRILLASVLAIAPIALLITTEVTDAGWRKGYLGPDLVQTFEWIRDTTPEDSLILSNVRSAGIFELYANRLALTEGQVMYLFPDQLDHSLTVLDGAQGWFSDPDIEFLREYGVDYVVAIRTQGVLPGEPYAGVADPRSYERLDFLRTRAEFGRAVVYEVVAEAPAEDQPYTTNATEPPG